MSSHALACINGRVSSLSKRFFQKTKILQFYSNLSIDSPLLPLDNGATGAMPYRSMHLVKSSLSVSSHIEIRQLVLYIIYLHVHVYEKIK